MLSGKTANINLIVFGLNRPEFEPTINSTLGEHIKHCIPDVVAPLTRPAAFAL
jgi:hypothetical protein